MEKNCGVEKQKMDFATWSEAVAATSDSEFPNTLEETSQRPYSPRGEPGEIMMNP